MKIKYIIFVLLALISYNCQRKSYCERKAKKFERLIKDCPSLIDTTTTIDTVVIRDTFTVTLPAKVDTIEFDSLLKAYCDEAYNQLQGKKTDSTKISIVRKKIYSKCSLKELLGSGVQTLVQGKDTLVIAYKGTNEGLILEIVTLNRNITKTNTLVTPCSLKWYNNPFYVMGAFLLGLLIVYILFRVIFKD